MPELDCRAERSQLQLSIVVPVYGSQDCLEALVSAIAEALVPGGWDYEVILVNDGSTDRSWEVIASLCRAYPQQVVGVDLRRNFGQDNAILTGIRQARGEYVAVMDDDLQHHPRHLPALVAKLEEGFDVVYADFRVKHQKFWKNLGSWFNGKVAEWVIHKPKEIYLSPYKVIRKEVADLAARYDGPDPYVDGLLFQVTSRVAQVPVPHQRRFAGTSTYTFWKSVRVWGRLAFSFSVQPLRLVTWFGFVFATLGVLMAFGFAVERIFFPEHFATTAGGWASLMVALLVLGGVQMVFLGILGEYVGRTYLRVNGKPQAAVRTILNQKAGQAARDDAVFDSALMSLNKHWDTGNGNQPGL
jgi:undecaprenyl-phosphate 4-deoxy-4-formamido-L-arabinose transferase